MIYTGYLKKAEAVDGKTKVELVIPDNLIPDFRRQNTKTLEVRVDDGRTITHDQRKKAYATIRDIADYTGDIDEYLKQYFKAVMMAETGCEYFSLSNCSISTAREYINTILDFAIDNGIPLTDLGVNRTDDVDRYIYKCLATKTCVITGTKNADIHHVLGSRIGMGGNRNRVDHSTRELIPLSRKWHTKVHAEGEREIFKKFGIYGIKVDRYTLKKLGLNYKDIN